MANVSPGVYTKIIDLSYYTSSVPSTIAYIPIICEQGEDNTLVWTNSVDYYKDFGEPNITYVGKAYGQGPYICSSFLKESDSLAVVRCLPSDASWSNLYITASTDATSVVAATSGISLNTKNELNTYVSSAENPTNCVVFYGIGRGEYYDNFQIKISQHANTELEGIYILDIYQKQEDDSETGEVQYEIIETYEVSFDYTQLDYSGESMFIEDIVNRYSRYIRCVANTDTCTTAISNNADFSSPFLSGAINLANGSSGTLFDGDGNIDGTVATQILTKAYSGTLEKTDGELLTEVLDTENNYFSLVFDGGYPSDVKTTGIYTLVTTRLDCMGFVDNTDTSTINDAITMRANTHTFNTKYLALYEPYTQIYDEYTGRDIWISPIYHMANIVPYNDSVSEVWYAPAGFNRATISTIKKMRFNPLLGDRDRLYLAQINPIVKFSVGYTVWGQLTTQKRSSALQDVNIMRLVLYCKRALEEYCKYYVFEQNDQVTWTEVASDVNSFLTDIKNNRGLDSFTVVVNATDYEKKQKKFHVYVTLDPTRTTEQINLNFYIE